MKVDDDGLVVADERRRRLALPITVESFLPAMAVIRNRLKEVSARRVSTSPAERPNP